MVTNDSSTGKKRKSSWNWRDVFAPKGLVGIVLLLFLAMYFHVIGRHFVNAALQRVYIPPALTHDRVVLFREFIRIVEAHPEYKRVHLDDWGRLSARPSSPRTVVSQTLRLMPCMSCQRTCEERVASLR